MLTAGMLPTVPTPVGAGKTEREQIDFWQTVVHAVSLYREMLEAISVKPGKLGSK